MILKMTDRTEMFVDDHEGQAIKTALTKSAEGFITVRGITLKKTAVLKLEPGGIDPRANLFDTPEHRKALITGSCRGEKSINHELMRIATEQEHNPKLLADKAWRENTKAKLLKRGEWCDQSAGTCACQPA